MAKHYRPGEIDWETDPIEANLTSKAFYEQVIDRSVKTALQSLAVFLGGGTGLIGIDWKQALIAVGTTVAITIAMSLSASKPWETESFAVDLLQRAARTFIAHAVGALVALESFENIDWANIWSLAGSATLLSLITSYLSRNVGIPGTASVLRGAELPPVPRFIPLAGNPYEGRDR